MAQGPKKLEGYIQTSNMYLIAVLALAVGFFGGVLFSSYRMTSVAPTPAGMPAPAASTGMPMTSDQSQTLNALLEATRVTPDNVKAWTQLGHFYFDSGKHAEAIEAYKTSLVLDGNRPDVWTDMGIMYRRTKQAEKAIESFDRAIELNPSHQNARFNKGVVYMHDLNDTKSAIAAWEALVQMNPNAKAPNGQLVRNMLVELKKR